MYFNRNIYFVQHKEKFKPVLDEISQLDISYSNSLKYDLKSFIIYNSSSNYFKDYTKFGKFNCSNNLNWDPIPVMKQIKSPKLFDTYIDYDIINYLTKLIKVLTNKSYLYNLFNLIDINFLFSIIQYNIIYSLSINLLLTSYFFYSPYLNYNLIGLKENMNFSLITFKNFFSLITFISLSCICYTFTNKDYTILNSIVIILLYLSLYITSFGFRIFV
jgi:hypothetical protein